MVLLLKWVVVFSLMGSPLITYGQSVKKNDEINFSKKNIEVWDKKNTAVLSVEIAETDKQHAHGLMFREKLNNNEGMLFVFNDEQVREFWMKNTLIDLDIGYFNKKMELIDIKQMKAVTSIMQTDLPAYPSKSPAMYALEVTKGWFRKNKIGEGAKFKFSNHLNPVENKDLK